MLCQNCGNEVPQESIFCPYCGAKIEQEQTPLQNNTEPVQNSTAPEDLSIKKKKRIIIGLISAIVIVALVAVFVVLIPIIRCNHYISLGEKRVKAGKYEEAVDAYNDALKIKSSNKKAINGLSKTYVNWVDDLMEKGEYDEALAKANEAVEEVGTEEVIQCQADTVVKYCDAELELGNSDLDSLSYDDARAAYEKILEINPESEDAYLGVIEVDIRNNEFETALEVAKKAYSLIGGEKLNEKIEMLESGNVFASNGWVMRETGYDSDHNPVYIHEYTYNIKGDTASITWKDPDGTYRDRIDLEYNDKGWETVSYSYVTSTGELNKKVIEYDGYNFSEIEYEGTSGEVDEYKDGKVNEDGKTLEWTRYNEEHDFLEKRIFDYDENGHNIKQTLYTSQGNISEIYDFEFNDLGKVSKRIEHREDGYVRETVVYEYNEAGIMIKETTYDDTGKVVRTVESD